MADLGKDSGLQGITDKRLMTVPDARDVKFEERSLAIERILALTGGDTMSIPRKYKTTLSYRPFARLLMLANQQPRFNDNSGALSARQITIRFDRSFQGKEDYTVTKRLLAELPGIANWALEGLLRLRKNGLQFSTNRHIIESAEDLRRSQAPIYRFAEDCLIVTQKLQDSIAESEVYAAYELWVSQERLRACARENLMTGLEDTLGGNVRRSRPGTGSGRPRVIRGISGIHEKWQSSEV